MIVICVLISLDSSNSVETLCDSWVLSTSVGGTGSFSAPTVTYSTSENAHETQSISTQLRNPKNQKLTISRFNDILLSINSHEGVASVSDT